MPTLHSSLKVADMAVKCLACGVSIVIHAEKGKASGKVGEGAEVEQKGALWTLGRGWASWQWESPAVRPVEGLGGGPCCILPGMRLPARAVAEGGGSEAIAAETGGSGWAGCTQATPWGLGRAGLPSADLRKPGGG